MSKNNTFKELKEKLSGIETVDFKAVYELTAKEDLSDKYLKCPKCGTVTEDTAWAEFWDYSTDTGRCPNCNEAGLTPEEILVPFTKEDLDKLDNIKKQKAKLEKEEKDLLPKVKNFLVQHEISQFKFDKHVMVVTYQDRSTMDEEKLVKLLQEKFDEETLQKYNALLYKSNPDAVTELIKDGLLTLEEISECKIQNKVAVFNLNPKPKKKKKENSDSFGGMF